MAIPITNASVNPARSIASAIFAGGWAAVAVAIFIVVQIMDGTIAALVYGLLRIPVGRITPRAAEESWPSEQSYVVSNKPFELFTVNKLPVGFTANHLTRASLERDESKETESCVESVLHVVHDVNVG